MSETPKDDFLWLEETDTPESQAWITAQAKRADEYLHKLPGRDALRDELKNLIERDSEQIPRPRARKYFFAKRLAKEDLPSVYVKESLTSEPRKLIDANTLSPDKTTTLSGWTPSWDARHILYELSTSGNDKKSLHVLSVETGENLPEVISDDVYPDRGMWSADSRGFWYTRRDPSAPSNEAKFHKRVFFHALGTDIKEDKLVFGEGQARETWPAVWNSSDGRYVMAELHGQEHGEEWSEVYVQDTHAPDTKFTCVLPREPGVSYDAQIHRGRIYVVTNKEAPHKKIISATAQGLLAGTHAFETLVREEDSLLESVALVGGRIFVTRIRNASSVLEEYTLDGLKSREVSLPTLGSIAAMTCEPEGRELFFSFSSFAYPLSFFRIELESGEVKQIYQVEAKFAVESLVTEQVWCTSKDGTRVPMFLVHKTDLKKDGTNPAMLYGYGGFDISLLPSFNAFIVPFVERGGVYAVANLRGGGEFGKAWHDAGRQKNKQNVFDDFIAAAEYLVSENYTTNKRLGIMGGSNGGLLVAATITQRPHLVAVAIPRVPVADMLRFHLHHGGRHWIPDYGNPDDPDMAKYLLTYSPYHNVRDGEQYPATLVMTAEGDDRVHPLHSYKLAARLMEANASSHPILLRVELKAGHSGAGAASRAVEQEADMWSFVFEQLGVR